MFQLLGDFVRYRPPIPGVRHSHGPGFGVKDRVRVRDRVRLRVRDRARVRVRRTVGMADPGNGGPEPFVFGFAPGPH